MKKWMYLFALVVAMATLILVNVSLFASMTDDRIEASARQSYVFKTYLKGDDVKVRSKDGAVSLTGTVVKESHRTLAQGTFAHLAGVKSVDNKLEVKGEDPAARSDAWLITKVKNTLALHQNVSATGTGVLAKDGTIILRGAATSAAQKDLATKFVNGVQGVKGVKNQMTIEASNR
jgi:osmotically-inducible protein OsmY